MMPEKDFVAVEQVLDDNPWLEGRVGLITCILFFGVFGLWAAFAPLDAGVMAAGEVKVAGNRVVVQHRDGGVISRLAVHEGDHVETGQILLELSAVELAAQERGLAGQAIELEASRDRLLAEAMHRTTLARPASWSALPPEYVQLSNDVLQRQQEELDTRRAALSAQVGVQGQRQSQLGAQIGGYQQQIASVDEQVRLVTEELGGLRRLAEQGFAPETRVRATERAAAELAERRAALVGQIAQAHEGIGETRMQSLALREDRAQGVAQELRQTDVQIADVMPRLQAVRVQLERARVRAPSGGVVVALAVFNEGAVVGPGEHILDIVPDDQDMILQVSVRPVDADNVHVGQRAIVRLSAFEGRRVSTADGVVHRISADRFEDQRTGSRYFMVEVKVSRAELQRVAQAAGVQSLTLTPGLPVEVMIPLRKRTALQYLVDPLTQTVWRSFREN